MNKAFILLPGCLHFKGRLQGVNSQTHEEVTRNCSSLDVESQKGKVRDNFSLWPEQIVVVVASLVNGAGLGMGIHSMLSLICFRDKLSRVLNLLYTCYLKLRVWMS